MPALAARLAGNGLLRPGAQAFICGSMFFPAKFVREQMNAFGARAEAFFFAVDYELSRGIFLSANELPRAPIFFRIGNFKHVPEGSAPFAGTPAGAKKKRARLCAFPEPLSRYRLRFERVMQALRAGDTFLANLTVRTPIEINLSLEEIFALADAPFSVCVPARFVCFSPERFVKISGGEMASFPMKGTIDATLPGAASQLLSDEKELREHRTIVDLIRNDLNCAGTHVRVRKFRFLSRVRRHGQADILQTSSEIRARVGKEAPLGDLVFSMLPAGSVSGAPKKKTVEILREAEAFPRGFYCGVCGFFDGKTLDSGVMIRFVERDGNALFYRSGGGLTSSSDCATEYAETLEKIYLP